MTLIHRRVYLIGLTQVARELGLSPRLTSKALRKVRWACPPQGNPPKWDPRVVDLIHAMRGEPHRPLEPVQSDWLARFQKGT